MRLAALLLLEEVDDREDVAVGELDSIPEQGVLLVFNEGDGALRGLNEIRRGTV
jgi:hypothetical protein